MAHLSSVFFLATYAQLLTINSLSAVLLNLSLNELSTHPSVGAAVGAMVGATVGAEVIGAVVGATVGAEVVTGLFVGLFIGGSGEAVGD